MPNTETHEVRRICGVLIGDRVINQRTGEEATVVEVRSLAADSARYLRPMTVVRFADGREITREPHALVWVARPTHPARVEARRLRLAWHDAHAAGADQATLDRLEAEWGDAEVAATMAGA